MAARPRALFPVVLVALQLVLAPAPVFAIAIYDANVTVSLVRPAGATIVLSDAVIGLSPPVTEGNGTAHNDAKSSPTSVAAFGSAQSPPLRSVANSRALSNSLFTITNNNDTSVNLRINASWHLSALADFGEVASAAMFYVLSIDEEQVFIDPRVVGEPRGLDSSMRAHFFALEPGVSTVRVFAFAEGQAISNPSPTPEPATLLLVGTTMAGLGLARLRQWRKKQL